MDDLDVLEVIIFTKDGFLLTVLAGDDFSDFPRLLAVCVKKLFLERLDALSRADDEESSTRFCGVPFHKLEVKNCIINQLHSIDDWKLIDLEVDIFDLHSAKVLSMSLDSKACDVRGTMALVLLGEGGSILIKL